MSLLWFLRLYPFYSILTAYFLHEEVISVRLYVKEQCHTNYKKIEIYSPPLWRKVNRLIVINILKGIKFFFCLKAVASCVPTVHNGDTIINPYGISNTFNYLAKTTKKHKIFSHILNERGGIMILQHINKKEIANNVSFLNSNKTSDTNSMPYRNHFFQKMKFQSSWQIYLTSFLTGIFPSVPRTAKVLPSFKKDSKWDYSNYRPVSLLSNIEKILEKLMHKRLYTFVNNNNINKL